MPAETQRQFHRVIDNSFLRFIRDEVDVEAVVWSFQIGCWRQNAVAYGEKHCCEFDTSSGAKQVPNRSLDTRSCQLVPSVSEGLIDRSHLADVVHASRRSVKAQVIDVAWSEITTA